MSNKLAKQAVKKDSIDIEIKLQIRRENHCMDETVGRMAAILGSGNKRKIFAFNSKQSG